MNATTDLNLNQADCIRTASSFGKTVYTNICSGTITTIDWGGVDWAAAIGCIGAALLVALIFLGMAKLMFFD